MFNLFRKDGEKVDNLRIAVMDDASHREITTFRIAKVNLVMIVVVAVLLIMIISYFLTSRTFLKHTIPGYPSAETKELAMQNLLKIDSLERVIKGWSIQVANIQRITTGYAPLSIDSISVESSEVKVDEGQREILSSKDSLLREMIRSEELLTAESSGKRKITQIEGLQFFTPVKGMITESYNNIANHPYIDVAASEGTNVYSVLDGTVISSDWNDETGYTLRIQHDDNLISVYKHNEKLLCRTGDKVKAGTLVALVGSSGALSTAPHLHFELWHRGEAIDPTLYIAF